MSNLEIIEFNKILRPRPILAVLGIFFIQLFPNWTACSPITYTNMRNMHNTCVLLPYDTGIGIVIKRGNNYVGLSGYASTGIYRSTCQSSHFQGFIFILLTGRACSIKFVYSVVD